MKLRKKILLLLFVSVSVRTGFGSSEMLSKMTKAANTQNAIIAQIASAALRFFNDYRELSNKRGVEEIEFASRIIHMGDVLFNFTRELHGVTPDEQALKKVGVKIRNMSAILRISMLLDKTLDCVQKTLQSLREISDENRELLDSMQRNVAPLKNLEDVVLELEKMPDPYTCFILYLVRVLRVSFEKYYSIQQSIDEDTIEGKKISTEQQKKLFDIIRENNLLAGGLVKQSQVFILLEDHEGAKLLISTCNEFLSMLNFNQSFYFKKWCIGVS